MARKFNPSFWLLFCAAFALPGLALLLLALLPFSTLKPVADALAKDGSMQSFTLPVQQSLRWLAGPLGGFLLAIAVFSLTAQQTMQGWLDNLLGWLNQGTVSFKSNTRQLIDYYIHVESDRRYLLGLLAITALGAASRILFLSLPIRYDEAYTFIAFAMRPLNFIVSNYHLPNNHVFHTILVYLTYHLFGDQLWSIRLPALLAGILIIPATYLVARLFYGRSTALFSAGLVAASSELIDFSTNARGYTLVCLFWLLLLALAFYLKDHRNWVGWGLFILLSALGFYTIPIMLYPFGAVMAWLFLSMLLKDTGQEYGRSFIFYLLAAGAVASLLTILLYTPIFYESGIDVGPHCEHLEQLESRSACCRQPAIPGRGDPLPGLPLASIKNKDAVGGTHPAVVRPGHRNTTGGALAAHLAFPAAAFSNLGCGRVGGADRPDSSR